VGVRAESGADRGEFFWQGHDQEYEAGQGA